MVNASIYKTIFGVKLTHKSVFLLAFLALFPNILGMISLNTPFGFNFHFFQILIFLAAVLYGPVGGATSGLFGSFYTAVILNNPYIIVGNIILGLFTGVFVRKKIPVVGAAMLAFSIQLPWLWYSDIFLAGMNVMAVNGVMIALFAGNLFWALIASGSYKKIRSLIR
ncbi:hypothetical protein KJ660_01870 [Candidatus Micrarchaeota archaeon]|nr:hypothetical protein [Candidatus Micrarchaeota archaeon]